MPPERDRQVPRLFSSDPTMPNDTVAFPPPQILVVRSKRVACDGGGGALGHPLVYMEMGDEDFVECGYCDRRFELAHGADHHGHETEFADPAANDADDIV
jgi:uncharacterized Zn-finger protein